MGVSHSYGHPPPPIIKWKWALGQDQGKGLSREDSFFFLTLGWGGLHKWEKKNLSLKVTFRNNLSFGREVGVE